MNAIEITPKIDRHASQSYESRADQREADRQSLRLTAKEREELEYLWRGYAAELGCRSLHGAIQDKLLRSPPRDNVRRLVVDELERAGGRAPEGAILRLLALDGSTRYETRRAIRDLVAGGKVEREPIDPIGCNDKGELTDAARESTGHLLRLVARPRGALTMRLALARVPLSPEEARRRRWQAQDDALESLHHTLVCGDAVSVVADVDVADSKLARTTGATLAALRAIDARHALVLRRVYGDRDPSARDTVFGKELAPLVTLTRCVESRRIEAETLARHKVAASAILRAMLDSAPTSKEQKMRWSLQRAAFIARVKTEAEKLLIDASGAYRAARRAMQDRG